MRKLIIDRKTWLRGADADGGQNSFLLRSSDGKRCCLGFYGSQIAGKKDEEMMDVQGPQMCTVGDEWGPLVKVLNLTQPSSLKAEQTLVCCNLIGANDSSSRGESDRERAITEHFRSIGVEVEFIN